MEGFTFYTFCDREYFEPLSRWRRGSAYSDLLCSLLPPTWTVVPYDIWLHATPKGARLRSQGFKIHVSGSLRNGQTLLGRVVPECVRSGTPFNVVRHLLDLGVEPGPRMGEILKQVYEKQLDGEIATLDEGMRLAREILSNPTRGTTPGA